jgi:hypothetical protein
VSFLKKPNVPPPNVQHPRQSYRIVAIANAVEGAAVGHKCLGRGGKKQRLFPALQRSKHISNFETQFKPLKPLSEAVTRPAAPASENEDEDENGGSEWDGFTDREEEILQVEVIEHKKAPNKPDDSPDKVDRKAFMVSSIDTLSLESPSNAEVYGTVDCEAAIYF